MLWHIEIHFGYKIENRRQDSCFVLIDQFVDTTGEPISGRKLPLTYIHRLCIPLLLPIDIIQNNNEQYHNIWNHTTLNKKLSFYLNNIVMSSPVQMLWHIEIHFGYKIENRRQDSCFVLIDQFHKS